MKVLVAIPHYCDPEGNAAYGSTGPAAKLRAAALARTITALHQVLGPSQAFLLYLRDYAEGRGNCQLAKVNQHSASALDVVVCTTGKAHLLDKLQLQGLFLHHQNSCDPMMLGFACHELLKSQAGKYDFYCYLEDDLLLQDTLFLQKLRWFDQQFGSDALLLPHRYEISAKRPLHKLYIDGPVRPDFSARWQNIEEQKYLSADVLGLPIRFERWANPHSGCFFLNAAQMERWRQSPASSDRDCSFAGPLESAASLSIMKTFRVYKPSASHAGFHEILHMHNRYLGNAVKLS